MASQVTGSSPEARITVPDSTSTQKPKQTKYTTTCCCPCVSKVWRAVCGFFASVWNLLFCKSKPEITEKSKKPEIEQLTKQIAIDPNAYYLFPSKKDISDHLKKHPLFSGFAPVVKAPSAIERIADFFAARPVNQIKSKLTWLMGEIYKIRSGTQSEQESIDEQTNNLEQMLIECATPKTETEALISSSSSASTSALSSVYSTAKLLYPLEDEIISNHEIEGGDRSYADLNDEALEDFKIYGTNEQLQFFIALTNIEYQPKRLEVPQEILVDYIQNIKIDKYFSQEDRITLCDFANGKKIISLHNELKALLKRRPRE